MSRTSASRRTHVVLSAAKDLLLLALLLSAPCVAVAQQGTAKKSAERELFRLENEWAQAVVKRDPAVLYRMTAPAWVYSDETGVMEREAGIKSFTTGTDTVRNASNEHMRAFVYDKAAVVIGVLVMKGSGASGPFTNRYRYTDSWVRLDGRWQCVASQDYLIPSGKR
ncbi:hypothetical protein BH11GEM1_BH11GEM1_10990 [soil metagenome]